MFVGRVGDGDLEFSMVSPNSVTRSLLADMGDKGGK